MAKYYNFLDDQINSELKIDTGFNNLVSPTPYIFNDDQAKKFFTRYKTIKEFQKISLRLFHQSLKNEIDPEMAKLVLNELPDYLGLKYHSDLPKREDQIPVFFRTDEVIPGKISEIQSPGSSWGLYEQIFNFYDNYSEFNKNKRLFNSKLSKQFATALNSFLDDEPILHHLVDNASIPNGVRYFIQQTRKSGLKYFGYDKGIKSYDCNFVRAHAFLGLISDNFRRFRLDKYEKGQLLFDLFPSILFDQKMPLIFPFHEKTRDFYSDEIRDIFPFNSIIEPDCITLENDEKLTFDEFCSRPQSKRDYFLKYAGSDLEINWGSKSVFHLGRESSIKCRQFLDHVIKGYKDRKYWTIQKAYFTKDKNVAYINRDNEIINDKAYGKFSGFYGPNGLMGILVMQRPHQKVHGSPETIISIA